jgi:hypothetical protein
MAAFGRHAADARGTEQAAFVGCPDHARLLRSLRQAGPGQLSAFHGPRGGFGGQAETIDLGSHDHRNKVVARLANLNIQVGFARLLTRPAATVIMT